MSVSDSSSDGDAFRFETSAASELRAAAAARVAVNKQRVILILLFTACCGLLIQNWPLVFTWSVAAMAAQFGNRQLAQRIVRAPESTDIERLGLHFLLGSGVSGFILACIAPLTWFLGGEAGRMAALFLSAGALVNIAVFAHRVKALAAVLAAPYVLVIAAPAFMSFTGGADTLLQGLCVAVIGVAFLGQIKWALETHSSAARALEFRTREAEARRCEAEAASQAKSEFIANISHELRTPLNAIIGYNEMVAEELTATRQYELSADTAKAIGAARHLLEIINQVLDMAKFGARDAKAAQQVYVAGLVNEVVDMVAGAATESRVKITVRMAPDVQAITTDPLKLRQCLLNLVANAVKFTRDGVVEVSVVREQTSGQPSIRFDVRDTGIGIPPEKLSQIFEPFAQADGSITRRYGGTGLGLAITQKLVRSMSGDVTVVSAPGQGSTFTLRVPECIRLAPADARYAA
jgi:signal transduction histidine kinase